MSRITVAITKMQFEFIRDRIYSILKDELATQYLLSYDPDLENVEVTIENNNPSIDKERLTLINVSTAQGDYDGKHQGWRKGTYQYFIDVYTSSKTSQNNPGDYLSSIKLHKFIRMVSYILEDPQYKVLGFANSYINRTLVNGFKIAEANKEDALNTMMGRITFTVEANESNSLITPNLIAGYETQFTLNNTGLGYNLQV